MKTTYRPDIDGLRAISILLVVLFHSNVSVISGGFVGVDVFFVISGFLITSIIGFELARDTFSIATFYERRIRTFFPTFRRPCRFHDCSLLAARAISAEGLRE